MSLWAESKRRDVFKVAVAYLIAAWLIIQVVSALIDPLNLPDSLDTVASGQRLTVVVAILFVLATGLMAANWFAADSSPEGFGSGSRLAILPCTDLSPDPSNAFFAPGIHHLELIRQLGSLNGLGVISPPSVQQFADGRTPIPEIAEALQVEAVMQCSVQYSGDRVLMTAFLFDGASDTFLWSEAYQANITDDLSELYENQADITMNVANALLVGFLDDERERIQETPTDSREAHELYLASLAGASGYSALPEALALVNEAIAIDPQCAAAWALKAKIHGFTSAVTSRENVASELAAMRQAAQTSVELDPNRFDSQAVLAVGQARLGDWFGAEASYSKALELRANDFPSVENLYQIRQAIADFEGAHELLESARRDDPINPRARSFYQWSFVLKGEVDLAEAEYERVHQLFGESGHFGGWFLLLGRFAAEGDINLDGVPDGWLLGGEGREILSSPEGGSEDLRRLYESGQNDELNWAIQVAAWSAYLGDTEYAAQLLEPVIRLDAIQVHYLWAPHMSQVRQLPQIKALLRDIGLTDYWDKYGWPEICRPLGGDDFECN